MQIFRCNYVAFGCLILAVVLKCPSAYGQLNHNELMDEYARQMQLLPPMSVTTKFESMITEDELRDRLEPFLVQRRRKLLAATDEQLEQLREHLKTLPAGEISIQQFVDDQDKASFAYMQDKQRTAGIYEFFGGNHNEIRSYSPTGDILRTSQFGLTQPKLRSLNQNVWVSKEFNEKYDTPFILSESKIALPGMLPVGPFKGPFHRSIDQKFPSGFDRFWEKTPVIEFWGKAGEADVYIKQDPDDATNWLVACFENPRKSIVPLWLVEVFERKHDLLDASLLPNVIDVVAQLPKNESTLSPEEKVIHSLVLFEERTDIEEFKGYPRAIRLLAPNHWESDQAGFDVNSPLLDFRMQVTSLIIRPTDREAIEVEDWSSYFDSDRKIGSIIGIGGTLNEIIQHSSLGRTPNGIRLQQTRGGHGPRF